MLVTSLPGRKVEGKNTRTGVCFSEGFLMKKKDYSQTRNPGRKCAGKTASGKEHSVFCGIYTVSI